MIKKRYNKPELLAPAGDLLRAKTAIRFGADAVYIGGRQFSLRHRASNFSLQDIQTLCNFAKENNAKVYVTVNEIPHQEDFEDLQNYLETLQEIGVNAVIVASPSIMALSKKVASKLEVHCSTQFNITNRVTIDFLKETLDVDRVVLARECSLDCIKDIVNSSAVQTEVFIHGGMCVNYSGRCTLSNHMTLRDANRGGCAQSCRWSYSLYEDYQLVPSVKAFTMGSKDLCAYEYIAEMMKIGVSSFKIEGRMKTEYYVASTVSAYRHLLDELYQNGGILSKERMDYYFKEITKAQNRATFSGLFEGDRGSATLITHENSDADVNHDFVGIVEEVIDDRHACLMVRNVLRQGDTIEVLSPKKYNRTMTVTDLVDEKGSVLTECRNPMKRIVITAPFSLSKGDILRKVRSK